LQLDVVGGVIFQLLCTFTVTGSKGDYCRMLCVCVIVISIIIIYAQAQFSFLRQQHKSFSPAEKESENKSFFGF